MSNTKEEVIKRLNKSIVCIMEEFEFDEVHEIMEKMDYRWSTGNGTMEIPSVKEIKSFVLKELMNLKDMALAKEDESEFPLYAECGRFIFRCYNDGYMSVIFAPESVNSFEYLEDGE